MEPAIIAVIAMIGAALVSFVVRLFLRPKRPPTQSFKCARCSRISRHSERTAEAWRRNVKQLFCDSCHRRWLEAQPRQVTAGANRPIHASSKSGCFSVLLVLAIVPIVLFALVLYAQPVAQADSPGTWLRQSAG